MALLAGLNFKDRVALITGASTGIGASTAVKLAECGVKVAINYFHSEAEAKKVAKAVGALNAEALRIKADVRNAAQVRDMIVTTVKKFGKLDILVNNAGGLVKRVPVAEMDDVLWDEIANLNMRSVFYCSRTAIPHMVERKYGRIINVSSIAAFGTPQYTLRQRHG